MEPLFTWNGEAGIASCIIAYKDKTFCGTASCHPDDADFKNRTVGQEIAYRRAMIEYLYYVKESELEPAYKALKQLYYSMKHSTHFNPKSYENKMLQRQIRNYEDDIQTIKERIAEDKVALKIYIAQKEGFYQALRKNRNRDKTGQE